MTDFWLYLTLGLEHVLDWGAYDHVLFLIALSASYSFHSWKRLLLLVTLFTLGHTISLLLAHFNVVMINSGLVECLIPITILFTALYNVFTASNTAKARAVYLLYGLTLFFGLIHGFGFATYYQMISVDASIAPLLMFALGVELSQIIVVLIVLMVAFATAQWFKVRRRDWILVVSAIIIGMTIPMLSATCFGA